MPLQDLLNAVQMGHPKHGYRRLVSPQFHQVLRENLPDAHERKNNVIGHYKRFRMFSTAQKPTSATYHDSLYALDPLN